jgi:hypothetical protein
MKRTILCSQLKHLILKWNQFIDRNIGTFGFPKARVLQLLITYPKLVEVLPRITQGPRY